MISIIPTRLHQCHTEGISSSGSQEGFAKGTQLQAGIPASSPAPGIQGFCHMALEILPAVPPAQNRLLPGTSFPHGHQQAVILLLINQL